MIDYFTAWRERGREGDLQGSPKLAFVWELDGLGYGKPRALTENGSGLPDVAVDGSVFARDVPTSSLRTEPDIDTILPLPGAGQMVNVVRLWRCVRGQSYNHTSSS